MEFCRRESHLPQTDGQPLRHRVTWLSVVFDFVKRVAHRAPGALLQPSLLSGSPVGSAQRQRTRQGLMRCVCRCWPRVFLLWRSPVGDGSIELVGGVAPPWIALEKLHHDRAAAAFAVEAAGDAGELGQTAHVIHSHRPAHRLRIRSEGVLPATGESGGSVVLGDGVKEPRLVIRPDAAQPVSCEGDEGWWQFRRVKDAQGIGSGAWVAWVLVRRAEQINIPKTANVPTAAAAVTRWSSSPCAPARPMPIETLGRPTVIGVVSATGTPRAYRVVRGNTPA